jgi:putative ABC transport system substrate-binding protein
MRRSANRRTAADTQAPVPNLDKVSMVWNGGNANNAAQFDLVRSEARGLGIEVQALDIRKPDDVEPAFDRNHDVWRQGAGEWG